jgi:hypothetical protein
MLKAGGTTAFLTIVLSPGLSKADHRKGARLGPRAVASTRPLDVLMAAAGFSEVEVTDVTNTFLEVALAWQRESVRHERELRQILGNEWEERLSDRAGLIRGVEQGLLRRLLIIGRAPKD